MYMYSFNPRYNKISSMRSEAIPYAPNNAQTSTTYILAQLPSMWVRHVRRMYLLANMSMHASNPSVTNRSRLQNRGGFSGGCSRS